MCTRSRTAPSTQPRACPHAWVSNGVPTQHKSLQKKDLIDFGIAIARSEPGQINNMQKENAATVVRLQVPKNLNS